MLDERLASMSPDELRSSMRSLGYRTQNDLAQAIGVSRSAVSLWLEGKVGVPRPVAMLLRMLVSRSAGLTDSAPPAWRWGRGTSEAGGGVLVRPLLRSSRARLLALVGGDGPVMVEVLASNRASACASNCAWVTDCASANSRVIRRSTPRAAAARRGPGLLGFVAGQHAVVVGVEPLEHQVGALLGLLAGLVGLEPVAAKACGAAGACMHRPAPAPEPHPERAPASPAGRPRPR